MKISQDLLDEMVAHAREDLPNECCGMVGGRDGEATIVIRVANRIAGEIDSGNVVFIVPDDGWKYLSSGVYTKPIEEIENLDSTVWW